MKQKQTHRYGEQIDDCQRRGGRKREEDFIVQTSSYK